MRRSTIGILARTAVWAACVVLIGSWLRSYIVADVFCFERDDGYSGSKHRFLIAKIMLRRGSVRGSCQSVEADERALESTFHIEIPKRSPGWRIYWTRETVDEDIERSHWWERVGFMAHSGRFVNDAGSEVWILGSLPYWFILLVFSFMNSRGLLRKVVSRYRRKRGYCAACGYDIRANMRTCPECGAACKAADPAGVRPGAGD